MNSLKQNTTSLGKIMQPSRFEVGQKVTMINGYGIFFHDRIISKKELREGKWVYQYEGINPPWHTHDEEDLIEQPEVLELSKKNQHGLKAGDGKIYMFGNSQIMADVFDRMKTDESFREKILRKIGLYYQDYLKMSLVKMTKKEYANGGNFTCNQDGDCYFRD